MIHTPKRISLFLSYFLFIFIAVFESPTMATQYTAQDFTDLLKIPKGYKQFKKYVQTGKGTSEQVSSDHEGCLELDFWYEIECFKKDATLAYAQAMFSTYPFFSFSSLLILCGSYSVCFLLFVINFCFILLHFLFHLFHFVRVK